MILLTRIEERIKDGVLRDQILQLNLLVPRMDVNDCLDFMSVCAFLEGLRMGIDLVRKAQRLESFDKERNFLELYLAKLDKLYKDYSVKGKNAPN
jgi:hypothetical protein